jgi:exo-beta-1,3-glucanase (GH17 family)
MKGLFALLKKIRLIFMLGLFVLTLAASVATATEKPSKTAAHAAAKPMHCLAFSPYVGTLNPNWAHPAPALIDTLLDKIVKDTPFRCIMTYGVLNGLDYTFKAAKARNLQTIAILWIDKDIEINTQSIARGIALAREFPETIVKISCGSEVRTRHGPKFDSEITRCLNAMKEAKITQPITTIDTWWEWCDRATPCRKTGFEASVDWIGVNVFPWWENVFAGKHSCTPASKAADFTISRLEEIRRTYPDKDVVLTEFGWPDGPEGAAESNKRTGDKCGIAGKDNQILVVKTTLKKLKEKQWSGNVFSAFSENWKPEDEGHFGKHWGICQGEPPYECKKIAD